MARRPLRHLLPEHPLHLALAAPSSTGSPEELFGEPVANHWFGIADAGRISGLLREYRIEIVTAAMRGVPSFRPIMIGEPTVLHFFKDTQGRQVEKQRLPLTAEENGALLVESSALLDEPLVRLSRIRTDVDEAITTSFAPFRIAS